MKSLLCGCIITYCAIASSGCGSNAAGKAVLGSYSVMISSNGKSDPDLMTVSPGTDDKLLFTFAAGITTDIGAVNANGLRADLKGSSMIALDAAAGAHRPLDGLARRAPSPAWARSAATAPAT